MTKFFIKTIVAVLMVFSPLAALAADVTLGKETYNLDKRHTNIMWFASHMGYSKSMGQFMDFEGQVTLDHGNPDQSSVTISLKTASIMTGLPDFDKHLKSPDFFDVEKFPTATFTSTKVTLLEDNQATVEGNFTLLGITKPLTLKVRLNKRARELKSQIMRAGFSAKATIKRSDWGMKAFLPFIGDKVILQIEAEAGMSE